MDINQNLNNLMKEAQKMQQRMQDAQQKLSALTVLGEAGGGMVKIKMNGRHDVLEVKINPSLLEEDPEMLEDLLAAAINDAVRKIEVKSKEEIARLTQGLQIPPNFMGEEEK
ncbi:MULTISPECIES: YbaB/EbfC family nucleoid-associated protein [Legionella]|uniref:Nucleoid-associated protein EKM59_06840 n=1 Tax=Legionella septentrionalis TaxID=2498109 RepID=A0A433JIQ3_9GAMM|nr:MULTISPECIES: YbaB/EbfC family nucleoid-associated protein [Legionella]MCP0913888.1 YbaB/EbfC family nucleoid-associated protein [Legionella sp. 27cVA30]RUQ85246.1 YbaB/EbfC family nucleoid-associated protein [Legionella septentrionalis]RUQ98729.1 YbaB/EbfC family nucleoid-associated protein [Legionella septentrionalis]RUR09898.1 YbaB/EbfC family nucleoid-associated protein [Legionella septentrionalis]RUR15022.1 YbaB/EbfC family nucleoid-associated protein [Legionella septentrionalis]